MVLMVLMADDLTAGSLQSTRIHLESAAHALGTGDAGHWCLAAVVNVDTPRLVAAVEAALAKADEWDAVDPGHPCAAKVRDAITSALKGETAGSDVALNAIRRAAEREAGDGH